MPPPRDTVPTKDARIQRTSPLPPQLPDRRGMPGANSQQQQIAQIVEPTMEQLDSIKKYQVSQYKRFILNINTGQTHIYNSLKIGYAFDNIITKVVTRCLKNSWVRMMFCV